MEIIMTVLITLGVMAVCYAFTGVVRLQNKTNDIEYTINNEIRSLYEKIDRNEEDMHRDYDKRINEWVSSTDRRFDYLRNDIEKLDSIINPNKDLIK
tara:strand:+ start:565 stop:855 length:291 start_codon:yes stop_codon:yes gene_type:complete